MLCSSSRCHRTELVSNVGNSYFFHDVPDLRLSSNGRRKLHFQEEGQLVKAEREKFAWLFKEARLPKVLEYPVALHWTYYFRDYRHAHDAGNLHSCTKPLEDALQDIGILVSDGPKHVRRISYGVIVTPHQQEGIALTIEEA